MVLLSIAVECILIIEDSNTRTKYLKYIDRSVNAFFFKIKLLFQWSKKAKKWLTAKGEEREREETKETYLAYTNIEQ